MMEFQNYQEIIDFAVKLEIEAAAFYDEAAAEETRPEACRMLMDFAEEERKHQYLLQNLDCKDECRLVTQDYKFKWIRDIKRSDLLTDMEWQKGMPYRDLLIVAMKREEKALQLYNMLLLQSETETAKNIFKILCQEEAAHKLALEKLYDEYMAQMGD
jgi:rubrerythrin